MVMEQQFEQINERLAGIERALNRIADFFDRYEQAMKAPFMAPADIEEIVTFGSRSEKF